jgi:hypothetical protein
VKAEQLQLPCVISRAVVGVVGGRGSGGAGVRVVAHDATVQARRGFLAARRSHVGVLELRRPREYRTEGN